MFIAVIGLLTLPGWHRSMSETQLTQHLSAAIYRFQSDAMPRCEQFVQQTRVSPVAGGVLCQTRASGFSV